MKFAISTIFLITLVGCVDMTSSCPDLKYKEYKYGDTVVVKDGFYASSQGMIVKRSYKINTVSFCKQESYIIRLLTNDEVEVNQDDIRKL